MTPCDGSFDPKSLEVVKGVVEERWVWSWGRVCGQGGGGGKKIQKYIFLKVVWPNFFGRAAQRES